MLNFFDLNGVGLPLFQHEMRHQIQYVLDKSSLRLSAPSLCQVLTRPGSLMAYETTPSSNWRWCWLLPATYRALSSARYDATEVACLSAIIECLQIASERQTPASSIKIDAGDRALYAHYHSLNQSLYSLALELAFSSRRPFDDCSQHLAKCHSVNSIIMQLSLALQEESEQLLAEIADEGAYILTIGRRQAALGGGATELAAIAAGLTPAEVSCWRQFGYNLGITVELIEQLEYYANNNTVLLANGMLPLKSLPFLYALSSSADENALALAWHKEEWQVVKDLVRQSNTLEFVKSLAYDWLEKTNQALNPLPAFLTPLLKDCRNRLQSVR